MLGNSFTKHLTAISPPGLLPLIDDLNKLTPPSAPLYIPPDRATGGTGDHTGVILIVVFVFLIALGLSSKCIKKMDLIDSEVAHNTTVPIAPPAMNMVEIWTIHGATMDMFLEEMARDKPIRYSALDLCCFTNNYSTKLGSGGFGVVFKGELSNGMKVAVKVLNKSSDKKVIEEQFMAEVRTIGRTYHINLVRLYGFCIEHHFSALVYEYMENGSLDRYLFCKETVIEWEKLYDIAIGTAKGLAYLHEECHQRIVHYDIKPENILLDGSFSPKVADFGLAKLCKREDSYASVTGYRGTPGYSAPEFLLKTFPITHKCDVYSFGIVLFEILGRRRNANVNLSGNLDWFPRRVWEEYEKGRLMELTEDCEMEDKNRENAKRMFMVALWCVQDSPQARPDMSGVVKMIEGGVEIRPPPEPFKYLYSGTASASIQTSEIGDFTCSSNSTAGLSTSAVMKKKEMQRANSF